MSCIGYGNFPAVALINTEQKKGCFKGGSCTPANWCTLAPFSTMKKVQEYQWSSCTSFTVLPLFLIIVFEHASSCTRGTFVLKLGILNQLPRKQGCLGTKFSATSPSRRQGRLSFKKQLAHLGARTPCKTFVHHEQRSKEQSHIPHHLWHIWLCSVSPGTPDTRCGTRWFTPYKSSKAVSQHPGLSWPPGWPLGWNLARRKMKHQGARCHAGDLQAQMVTRLTS